jgi:hypothetical protein
MGTTPPPHPPLTHTHARMHAHAPACHQPLRQGVLLPCLTALAPEVKTHTHTLTRSHTTHAHQTASPFRHRTKVVVMVRCWWWWPSPCRRRRRRRRRRCRRRRRRRRLAVVIHLISLKARAAHLPRGHFACRKKTTQHHDTEQQQPTRASMLQAYTCIRHRQPHT